MKEKGKHFAWARWVFVICALVGLIYVLDKGPELLEGKYAWEPISDSRSGYPKYREYEEAEEITLSFVEKDRFRWVLSGAVKMVLTNNSAQTIRYSDDLSKIFATKTESGERLRCVYQGEIQFPTSSGKIVIPEVKELESGASVVLWVSLNQQIYPNVQAFPFSMQEPGEYEVFFPLPGKTYVTAPFTIIE